MKIIGMIFDDPVALNAAFFMKAFNVLAYKEDAVVNTGTRCIEYPDVRWQYVLIKDDRDLVKISGIQFDAIFSEVVDLHCKQYVMSRFRPGLNK